MQQRVNYSKSLFENKRKLSQLQSIPVVAQGREKINKKRPWFYGSN